MSAYREGFGPVEQRRTEVALVRARVDEAAPALDALRAQRIGRIAGSLVGLVALAVIGPMLWLADNGALVESPFLTTAFFGSAVAAVGIAFVVSGALRLARRTPRPGTPAHAAREARAAVDLLRAADAQTLAALDPWPRVRDGLAALEGPSVVLPLVLATMVLPLASHALLYLPIALLAGLEDATKSFSTWIALSAVIVGHAHFAVAVCAARWGRKMKGMSTEALSAANVRKEWTRALWIAVAVASVPGILLLAVPTVISLMTALAVLPLLWHGSRRLLLGERLVLEGVAAEVSAVRVGVDEMEVVRRELVAAAEPAERVRVGAEELVRQEPDDEEDGDGCRRGAAP